MPRSWNSLGLLSYPSDVGVDAIMEAAVEAGAEDVVVNDDRSIDVLTDADQFSEVRDALVDRGLRPESAEVTMRANNNNDLDNDGAQKMIRLLDMLEDLDDVQKVYSNAGISDEILASLDA